MLRLLRRGAGLAVLLLSVSRPGWADDDAATRSAARKIALDGIAALERGDAEVASQKLEKAYQVLKVPSLALWSARALAKRGQLVEASERYMEAARLSIQGDKGVQEQAQKDAARELDELSPRIPSLLISLEGAAETEVAVTLDGKSIPAALLGEERPVNPGTHQVVGKRGAEQAQETASVAETERKRVVLRFGAGVGAGANAASPATPVGPDSASSSPAADSATSAGGGKKTLAYVALAAGGAGLVLGGVTGFLALGKRSDLDDNPACRDGKCLASAQGDVDSLRTMRTLSTVGFIAGGVLGATGVVLLLTSGSGQEKAEQAAPRLALRVAPSAVSLAGSF